jgi:prolyl-tRNA editing enzyme YbaK/EbsC (Cys-tRNA(Pro) deacylase)
MSLETVRAFFSASAPDIEIIETEQSSATVAQAAEAHGVDPAQIAKTMCLRLGDEAILVVAGGLARLDNRKFKDAFGSKGRMLGADEVVRGHQPSRRGVCPFGLPSAVAHLLRCLPQAFRRGCAGCRIDEFCGENNHGTPCGAHKRDVDRCMPVMAFTASERAGCRPELLRQLFNEILVQS